MLTYNFTNIGSDSMYEYLYKCIKNDILQGNLQAGEKLPSKRSFAKNLGISVITVENAYEQLIAEGYIYSMPKRGFYVTDFKGVLESKQREEVQEIIPLTSGENSYLADFTSNQTEADQFPFTIWAKMVPGGIKRQPDPADDQPALWRNHVAQTVDRGLSERLPGHDGTAGADHHRSRNRVSVRAFDPAFGTRSGLCGGKSGVSEDRKNLSELSG